MQKIWESNKIICTSILFECARISHGTLLSIVVVVLLSSKGNDAHVIVGTPDQSCMPLFSLLNLPENGSVNSTPVRPVLSTADLQESINDEQDTVTSSTSTPAASSSSSRPPPPTYEPLSDDE